MGKVFILKRKAYTNETTFGLIDGIQIKNAKGIGGMA